MRTVALALIVASACAWVGSATPRVVVEPLPGAALFDVRLYPLLQLRRRRPFPPHLT